MEPNGANLPGMEMLEPIDRMARDTGNEALNSPR